jgi:hypothetical protein
MDTYATQSRSAELRNPSQSESTRTVLSLSHYQIISTIILELNLARRSNARAQGPPTTIAHNSHPHMLRQARRERHKDSRLAQSCSRAARRWPALH